MIIKGLAPLRSSLELRKIVKLGPGAQIKVEINALQTHIQCTDTIYSKHITNSTCMIYHFNKYSIYCNYFIFFSHISNTYIV